MESAYTLFVEKALSRVNTRNYLAGALMRVHSIKLRKLVVGMIFKLCKGDKTISEHSKVLR